ncbi:glutamyl-tRNA reductase [Mucilaginibacter rubeus]|uniref:Glutamyl-tRNA reductase n=1 Tax=Mucilaginibacter rubeus TaxID=2027860 RepID=A0A5C1HYU4_9SPHI|nr:glutamyl-tRNA reductase [Mucilaginibacter rubeus]QEM10649.1 glutamyl-tRNA reductase [Mucilaginibacter rubeus]
MLTIANNKNMVEVGSFYVVGINYKKSDSRLRGRFAISTGQYGALLKSAGINGVSSLFVLSTCNRTEIYGIANEPEALVNLLCSVTEGDIKEFGSICYVKQAIDAVEHLFTVAAGLDSQILGDYEIIGQVKQAVKFAKEHGFINTFLEKLYNTVLQASKQIKNQTSLSKGTTSISFAALQTIRQYFADAANILIVGAGKMSVRVCENIKDYLGQQVNVTLVNRTIDKAKGIANEFNIAYSDIAALPKLVAVADVVIVATASATPIIYKVDLENSSKKLIIDLSMPNNVEPAAADLTHVQLVNIDQLSLANMNTFQNRQSQILAAEKINKDFIRGFAEWCELRKKFLLVNIIKQQLTSISLNQSIFADKDIKYMPVDEEQRIQKILNWTVGKMKCADKPGCHYLEAINEYMLPLTAN